MSLAALKPKIYWSQFQYCCARLSLLNSLLAIHPDLPRSTGNIFKASKIFIPIHVQLTLIPPVQLAMTAVTGLSVLLVTFHLLMCSLFFVTVY